MRCISHSVSREPVSGPHVLRWSWRAVTAPPSSAEGDDMTPPSITRRRLLQVGTAALTFYSTSAYRGLAEQAVSPKPDAGEDWHGLKIGVASYTLRKLPL